MLLVTNGKLITRSAALPYKPYVIAAMILLAKCKDPQATLKALEERGTARWFQK